MKVRVLALFLAVIIGFALVPPAPAHALTVTGLVIEFRCDGMFVPSDYVLNSNRDNTGAGSEAYTIEVRDGFGKLLYLETGILALGVLNRPGGFFVPYSAAPAANPISFHWYSDAGNGLPQQLVYTAFGECPGLPLAPPEAEPVPGGFGQRMVVCDVAIYDEPAGQPVGDNKVTMYQNWHMNLTPVMGPDGQLWTEIFVAGPHTGYIPTACVW